MLYNSGFSVHSERLAEKDEGQKAFGSNLNTTKAMFHPELKYYCAKDTHISRRTSHGLDDFSGHEDAMTNIDAL